VKGRIRKLLEAPLCKGNIHMSFDGFGSLTKERTMKMFTGFAVLVPLFLFGTSAKAAEWEYVMATVKMVATSWHPDYACVQLESGEVAKISLASERGRAQFTMALSAFLSGRSLSVAFTTGDDRVGGCNVGQTVKPHAGFFQLVH
jgi:hypothetical protein